MSLTSRLFRRAVLSRKVRCDNVTMHVVRCTRVVDTGGETCGRSSFFEECKFLVFLFFRDPGLGAPKRISFRRAENREIRFRSAIQKRDFYA